MEIAGRHHDPFTLMEQFGRPIGVGAFSQPVTDIAGTLVARMSGPVAAYNWLVLITFPLSAAAAYLLARHLALSPVGATVAALAYAFSPFHIAQAAYHPHIAQTQWVPLYLLALWRCLDHASPGAVALLGAATIAVTLSNFYGGLIAAVITPVAVAAYWCFVMPRTGTTNGAPACHHRRKSCGHRRVRDGVRVLRCPRHHRHAHGLRVPAQGPVHLQRKMVELSGAAGRASTARSSRASLLDRRGSP